MARRTPSTGQRVAHMVMGALVEGKRPLGAYQILDRLRPQGVSSPPTVYRALEKLVAEGWAHRLETLNAFVACAHPAHRRWTAFSICRICGAVDEFPCDDAAAVFVEWASHRRFQIDRSTVELTGACADCQPDTGVETSPWR